MPNPKLRDGLAKPIRAGKPQMAGPAIDRLHLWREENNAPKAEPSKWKSNLDSVFDAFFRKHIPLFKTLG